MISTIFHQTENRAVEAAFLSVISRAIWMDISRFEREVLEQDTQRLYSLVYYMVERVIYLILHSIWEEEESLISC
jgi:hypothetical protein